MRIERLEGDDSPDAASSAETQRATALDRRPDPTDNSGQHDNAVAQLRYETRDRAVYYEELRAAVATDRRGVADHRELAETSVQPVDVSAEHDTGWPDSAPVIPRSDSPEEQHGNARQPLDAEVRQGYERIRETESTVITPAIRAIEAVDTGRELIGLDHRLKGEERLKEKVTNMLRAQPDMTTGQALTAIPDAVRFTFCYSEQRYASGVHADLERLHARGFEMTKPLKNYWAGDQYKGINTQWREPETGQRFEVQFHTQASFEAKQRTHGAYEQLRSAETSRHQQRELEHFQREVSAAVPVPPGATEISDYPREKRDG